MGVAGYRSLIMFIDSWKKDAKKVEFVKFLDDYLPELSAIVKGPLRFINRDLKMTHIHHFIIGNWRGDSC